MPSIGLLSEIKKKLTSPKPDNLTDKEWDYYCSELTKRIYKIRIGHLELTEDVLIVNIPKKLDDYVLRSKQEYRASQPKSMEIKQEPNRPAKKKSKRISRKEARATREQRKAKLRQANLEKKLKKLKSKEAEGPKREAIEKPLPMDQILPFEVGQKFYKSRAWQKCRKIILATHEHKCSYCQRDLTYDRESINVDHIIPLRRYYSRRTEISNLQILCCDCNKAKGNKLESEINMDALLQESRENQRKRLNLSPIDYWHYSNPTQYVLIKKSNIGA